MNDIKPGSLFPILGLLLMVGIAPSLSASPPQAATTKVPNVEILLAKVTAPAPAPDAPNHSLLKSQYMVTGKLDIPIKKVIVHQADNDSSRYVLYLNTDEFPADKYSSATGSSLVIKANDKIFLPHAYGGATASTISSIDLGILDRADAEAISGMTIPQVPKDSLQVRYIPAKSYALHGPIVVPIDITNVGTIPLTFFWGTHGGSNYPSRDTQHTFTATFQGASVPVNPKPLPVGFISSPYTAALRATLHHSVDLSQWLQFEKPGTYQIHATYTVTIQNPKPDGVPQEWKVSYQNQFAIEVGN